MSSKKPNKWDRNPTSKIRDQQEDLVLSDKNVQDTSQKSSGKFSKLKVEMKNLTISENAKKRILETLKFIHGEAFEAKDKSAYQDKGTNLSGQYWIDRGHLVIKESVDYSQSREILQPHEIIDAFALAKLEKYGFHNIHCKEALMATAGDVGAAYEFLTSRYMSLDLYDPNLDVTQLLVDERTQELDALRSIYEDCCEERIANQLWVVHLDLPYLANLYCEQQTQPQQEDNCDNKTAGDRKRNKELCKFFAKGYCKFGIMCKFSHDIPEKKPVKCSVDELENMKLRTKFELEIRFPKGCLYPLQAPLVSLYPLQCPMPNTARLRLSAHLQSLCNSYAEDETPCVYSLIDFLQNRTEDVLSIVQQRGPASCILSPDVHLIPDLVVDSEDDDTVSGQSPDTTDRQVTKSSGEKSFTREDDELCKMFANKQSSSKYKEFLRNRQNLPAWEKMKDVLEAVQNNQVIIISGETGCGKSTQVPQFILDTWLQNRTKGGSHVEIVCTQPRRLSAIGVAQRVAEERTERIGSSVGYQIRLESCVSNMTRLLFCTTGILLRRLEGDPTLSSVTHIIVDEVHERSEESDFLLTLLKEVLPVRPDLKVILMSATLNAELFCLYFGSAPIVYIPGYTFPVQQFFLEDILQETNYVLDKNSSYATCLARKWTENLPIELEIAEIRTGETINPRTLDCNLTPRQLFNRYKDYSKNTCTTLYLMDPDKINFELIECVLEWIVNGAHDFPKKGSILVFLPGMAEICTLHEQLSVHPVFNPRKGNFMLIPLHSSLSSEDQARVFMKLKGGVRKVVLSTNICETSITIDDCVFVIDSGKMKEKRFDPNKNMGSLETVWVSRANALQRKGRAGRVMPGVCIHLFTRHQFNYQFLPQPIPEIQRAPLEQIVLRIKMLPCLRGKSVESVLGSIIEPPSEENVISALNRLINIGALDKEFYLTSLGCHLAALPVDVRIGKLMLFGAIFSCLDSALTIAACLSHRSPFIYPVFLNKEATYPTKKEFAIADSDQLTSLKAYTSWRKAYNKSKQDGYVFAKEEGLSQSVLVVLADVKGQLLDLLIDIGFVPESAKIRKKKPGVDVILESTGPELNTNNDNHRLLVSILCAALYPNIVQVLTPDKCYAQTAGGAIPKAYRPEELKFRTRDMYVNLHRTSVLYNSNEFSSPYLVYQELIKTSRVFVRECSVVPVLPLILFAGSGLSVELHRGTFVISLEDGWIMFSVNDHQIAELIESIRAELLKLLDEKIKDPSLNLLASRKGRKVISTIIYLVSHG